MPAPSAHSLRPAHPSPGKGRGYREWQCLSARLAARRFPLSSVGRCRRPSSSTRDHLWPRTSINFENRMLVPLVSLLIKRSLVSAGNWTRTRHDHQTRRSEENTTTTVTNEQHVCHLFL